MKNLVFGKLSLENFRCHDSISIDFSENRFVGLTGENGAGKTSIFDGLCWILYDVLTDGKKVADDVVRIKEGKNCLGYLPFSIDSDKYEIYAYRQHDKHKNEKYLFLNGEDISGENRKTTNEKISNILMPQEVFLNCLLFSQFMSGNFANLKHSEQKDIINKMLNLDVYDIYQEKTGKYHKKVSREITKIETKINSIIEQIEYLKENINRQNKKFDKIVEEFEKAKINKENSIKQTEENLKELKEKYNQEDYDKVEQRLEKAKNLKYKIENSLETNEQQLKELISKINEDKETETNNKIQTLKNEYQNTINELNSKLNNIHNNIGRLENEKQTEISNLKEKYKDKKDNFVSNLDNEILKLNRNLNEVSVSKTHNESKLQEYQKEIEKLQNDLSKYFNNDNEIQICPTCGRPVTDDEDKETLNQHINHIHSRITELKNSVDNLSNEIKKQKSKIEEINNSIKEKEIEKNNEIESLKSQYYNEEEEINKRYKNEIDKIKLDKTTYETSINELKSEVSDKRNSLVQEIENTYSIKKSEIEQQFKEKFNDLNQKKEKTEQHINNLQSKFNKGKDLQEKIKNTENIIENEKNILIEIQKNHEDNKQSIKNDIKTIQTDISTYQERKSKLEEEKLNLKRKLEILSFWKKGFSEKGIKAILLDDSIPILKRKARELNELVDNIRIDFNSETELKSGGKTNKFSVTAIQNNNLSELSQLSSGEKRMANIMILLCLRNLLEEMNGLKINILLLDEILDTLDPKNARDAVNLIKQSCPDRCIILISHTSRDYIEVEEALEL
ncbi:MAG: AAA family ATPase [archaeon]